MSVTTLPSLHVGGKVTQQIIKHIPQPPSSKSSVSKSSRHYKKQNQQDLSPYDFFEKDSRKDSLNKNDSFVETSRYRNSYKHNLCLEMLQEGFHLAFCELFNLIEKQKNVLQQDNLDASENKVTLLEDDAEKLNMLKDNLIAAETAKRRGRTDQLYQSQFALAEYFSSRKDNWLSDYFYYKCLETSLQVRGDGGRKEGEANYNLGIASEKKMDYDQAVSFMEIFYNFSKTKDWEDDNGIKLHKKGCDSLQRMYTKIAEQIEEADPNQAVEYLLKAFEMAKEGENEKQIGEAGYRLGTACEENGETDAAIKYFTDYLKICSTMSDDVGRGKACQAMARAYHTQGDVPNAIHYLTMFLEIAESSGQTEARGEACSGLGSLYNSVGHYSEASQFFQQSFETSKVTNKLDAVESTRTEYGIGAAHELFERYTKFIVLNDKNANTRVMSWRDSRSEVRDTVRGEPDKSIENENVQLSDSMQHNKRIEKLE